MHDDTFDVYYVYTEVMWFFWVAEFLKMYYSLHSLEVYRAVVT